MLDEQQLRQKIEALAAVSPKTHTEHMRLYRWRKKLRKLIADNTQFTLSPIERLQLQQYIDDANQREYTQLAAALTQVLKNDAE